MHEPSVPRPPGRARGSFHTTGRKSLPAGDVSVRTAREDRALYLRNDPSCASRAPGSSRCSTATAPPARPPGHIPGPLMFRRRRARRRAPPRAGLHTARGRCGGDGHRDRAGGAVTRRRRDALTDPARDRGPDVGDARGARADARRPRSGPVPRRPAEQSRGRRDRCRGRAGAPGRLVARANGRCRRRRVRDDPSCPTAAAGPCCWTALLATACRAKQWRAQPRRWFQSRQSAYASC